MADLTWYTEVALWGKIASVYVNSCLTSVYFSILSCPTYDDLLEVSHKQMFGPTTVAQRPPGKP